MSHKRNRRCTRVCECGATFHPTIKFGNETKCDACYDRHREEFLENFGTWSDERQRQALAFLLGALVGIVTRDQNEPAQEQPALVDSEHVDAPNQATIDAEFTVLMEDIDLNLLS